MIRSAALCLGLQLIAQSQSAAQTRPAEQKQDVVLIFGVWTPGVGPLQVADFGLRDLLVASDKLLLDQSLSDGNIVITGGDSSGNTVGSPRRMIILFTGPLSHGVRLAQPDVSGVLYVQDGDMFRPYPTGAQLMDQVVEFTPEADRSDRLRYMNGRHGGSVFIGKPSLVQSAFPDPARTAVDQPVRIGGNVGPPRKIKDVAPVFPAQAIQAGIRGSVVLEIVVDQTGRISQATVLRSLPFLDQAALDCVKQWEYTPLVIDGMPRSVVMTVTVTFAP
jgi:TonB family protein